MLLAALALAVLQGPAEWEKFGPGSWAEYSTTGRQDGAEVRSTEKSIFKDATSTDVVISIEKIDAAGGQSVVDMRFPLPQRHVPKEDEGVKAGDEKLTIDGRAFACEIYERKGIRRWVSAEAPMNKGVLRSETISGSVQLATRVIKLEEKIKVGGATLTCWALQETTEIGDQKTTKTTWRCDEVPGGVVKTQVRQTRGTDVVVETVTTLTAFHVVKK